MDKNSLFGIIIVLIIGIIGAYYLKVIKTQNNPDQNQQNPDWDQWKQPQPIQPQVPSEVNPDKPKPLQSPKSYQEALSMAQSSNANIFLYFETNNCSYCKQMKTKTLSDPRVKEKLSSYVVYYCNATNERNVASKYKIIGVPAYFIVDKNETVLKSEKGFKTNDEFVNWLDGRNSNNRIRTSEEWTNLQ